MYLQAELLTNCCWDLQDFACDDLCEPRGEHRRLGDGESAEPYQALEVLDRPQTIRSVSSSKT